MSKVYEIVTEKILDQLKKGVVPWQMPWNSQTVCPCNLATKRRYHGLNVFFLALTPYVRPYWITYKQAEQNGGHVKKGEKSTIVIYWKLLEVNKTSEELEREERHGARNIKLTKKVPLLRYYRVFNVEQTEGLTHLLPEEKTKGKSFKPLKECEKLVKAYKDRPEIKEGASKCYYNLQNDFVGMVNKKEFDNPEKYYATLFHELTHSTGHENRLDRGLEANFFNEEGYGQEELIAEMGASFMANMAGIGDALLTHNAAYIDAWLKNLEANPKLVVFAASKAQKAVDYMQGVKNDNMDIHKAG